MLLNRVHDGLPKKAVRPRAGWSALTRAAHPIPHRSH